LRDRRDLLKSEVKQATEQCDSIYTEFSAVKGSVQEMVDMFVQARFRSTVANKMSYDEQTQFNEQNITSYLAEVEEYISNMIMMIAFQKQDPNAPISSIPLEKLTTKEFNRREMVIDAGNVGDKMSGVMTEAGEDPLLEDEMVVDPKMLYKNFVEMVESGKIAIGKESSQQVVNNRQ
jgi:DNA-binding FrmR family transcriptional regulator